MTVDRWTDAAERNGLKDLPWLDCGELPRDTMAIDAAFGAPPPPADPASDEYARWQYDWEPVTMHADSRDAAEGPAIQ